MGTTNKQLIALVKDLSIPNFYCICKDEMDQCQTENIPINIIVNLNDSDNNVNGHWCLSLINDDQKVQCLSFGDPIPNQVEEFMMKVDDRKILITNFQIQDFKSNTCGLYDILILFVLNNKIKFEDIIIGFV